MKTKRTVGRDELAILPGAGLVNRLLFTHGDAWSIAMARVSLGVFMLAHGLWKLGWFGGPGYEGAMRFFASVGVPAPLAWLVLLGETVGAVMLIAGAFARVAAAGTIAIALGAVFTVHLQNGFFMNWTGAAKGEGYEIFLLVVALAAQVVIEGAGAASVDARLSAFDLSGGDPRLDVREAHRPAGDLLLELGRGHRDDVR